MIDDGSDSDACLKVLKACLLGSKQKRELTVHLNGFRGKGQNGRKGENTPWNHGIPLVHAKSITAPGQTTICRQPTSVPISTGTWGPWLNLLKNEMGKTQFWGLCDFRKLRVSVNIATLTDIENSIYMRQ